MTEKKQKIVTVRVPWEVHNRASKRLADDDETFQGVLLRALDSYGVQGEVELISRASQSSSVVLESVSWANGGALTDEETRWVRNYRDACQIRDDDERRMWDYIRQQVEWAAERGRRDAQGSSKAKTKRGA